MNIEVKQSVIPLICIPHLNISRRNVLYKVFNNEVEVNDKNTIGDLLSAMHNQISSKLVNSIFSYIPSTLKDKFFKYTIPRMAHATMSVYSMLNDSTEFGIQPEISQNSILKQLPDDVVYFLKGPRTFLQSTIPECHFTSYQCFALNSASFFSSFSDFPHFNFQQFWESFNPDYPGRTIEKLKCFIEYFNQISTVCHEASFQSVNADAAKKELIRVVSFMLCPYYNSSSEIPQSTASNEIEVQSAVSSVILLGPIEWMSRFSKIYPNLVRVMPLFDKTNCTDASLNYSHHVEADFANRYLGGGVLTRGCVQEEIRFITAPELLVSRMVCAPLKDIESCMCIGARTFASHSGYANSFQFDGPAESALRDRPFHQKQVTFSRQNSQKVERLSVFVLAVDALHFAAKNPEVQLQPMKIVRELNKIYYALCNLSPAEIGSTENIFSTGNWGCGAFNGDVELKAVIQWIAASAAGWKVEYFPWNIDGMNQLENLFLKATREEWSVSHIASKLLAASSGRKLGLSGSSNSPFSVIYAD